MIRLFCYGDSNTWGYEALTGRRFPPDTRWPTVMEAALEGKVSVIESGVNGRTIVPSAPPGDPLNGMACLETAVTPYVPIDLMIIFLGINDLFLDPVPSARAIADSMEKMVRSINSEWFTGRFPGSVLLLPPLPVNSGIEFASMYENQIHESLRFTSLYREVARRCDVLCLDLSTSVFCIGCRRCSHRRRSAPYFGPSCCRFHRFSASVTLLPLTAGGSLHGYMVDYRLGSRRYSDWACFPST